MNPVSGSLPSSYQHQQHHGGATPLVVDPKFPPSEEYSQNNYIPSPAGGGAGAADFFTGHPHLNHPQHHLQYGYHQHHHHQATATPYGAANAIANGGYGGYGNYYHHQIPAPHHPPAGLHAGHQLRPTTISMHTDAQQPQQQINCGSLQAPPQPAVSNAGTILQSLADIAPAQQPPQPAPGDVSSGVCSPASVGHGGQDSRGSPPGVQQQQQPPHPLQDLGIRLEDNASDEQEDMDEEQMMDGSPLMDDDEDDDSESGDRVIYPWMKKIHVAGVGEYMIIKQFICLFSLCVCVLSMPVCVCVCLSNGC